MTFLVRPVKSTAALVALRLPPPRLPVGPEAYSVDADPSGRPATWSSLLMSKSRLMLNKHRAPPSALGVTSYPLLLFISLSYSICGGFIIWDLFDGSWALSSWIFLRMVRVLHSEIIESKSRFEESWCLLEDEMRLDVSLSV